MKRNILRLFEWMRCLSSIIACLLICGTPLLAQENTSYPAVRLDLNAGSFLNPLPFDRPFQIQGRVPQHMTRIQVTFEEFLDTGHSFTEQPERLAALETGVQALLDSMLLNPRAGANARLRLLERRLGDLLIQHAGPAGGKSMRGAMNILPWHWGRSKPSQSSRLLATGSLFDPSEKGDTARARFRAMVQTAVQSGPGLQTNRASARITDFVMGEVQDVRMASAPNPQPPAIRVTWQKLHNERAIHQEPLPVEAPSRWNRLEQRLRGDTATDIESFRLVVPPLKANRTYWVCVQAEHHTSADSVQTAPLTRYFWVDTRSSRYMSLDMGMLYAREINETVAYIGTNIYLRPVAKDVPLQTRGGFLRRFALTIGLAVQDIEDDRSTRRALVGPISVVLGAGIRVSKYVRLGGGVLVFRERDPETFPLTTRTSLTSSPYISASLDMDVGKQLKGLGGLFGILEQGGGE